MTTFSYSNLHDTTNSIIEISAVGVAGNIALVCMTVCTSMENGCTRYFLTQPWVNLRGLAGERKRTA